VNPYAILNDATKKDIMLNLKMLNHIILPFKRLITTQILHEGGDAWVGLDEVRKNRQRLYTFLLAVIRRRK
jgi:hypothetical protein